MVLKTKIIAIIACVVLFFLGITTILVLKVQQKKLIESTFDDAAVVSRIIEKSISDAMKRGSTDDVQTILENIGEYEELNILRIVSPDGDILKSKLPLEVGTKSRMFINYGQKAKEPFLYERKMVLNYLPILNKKECHRCHDPSRKINGIIELGMDFSRHKEAILSMKRFLFVVNLLAVIMIAAVLSILLTLFVVRPMKKLLSTIKEVDQGNWDARVDFYSNDEMGIIGASFNKMIAHLKNLYDKNIKKERELSKVRAELEHKKRLEELNEQLQYKVKEVETANKAIMSLSKEIKSKNIRLSNMVERLKTINEVGRALSSIVDSKELVRLIIKTTADMLDAKEGAIHLSGEKMSPLTIKYQHGSGLEDHNDITLELKPIYLEVCQKGKPLLKGNGHGPSAPTVMAVPLKLKHRVIGAIILQHKTNGEYFSDDELEILSTLANQAMVAIENAWLYEKVKTSYFATIQSLVNALEANDRYTKGHSERVRTLAVELGRHIGLDYHDLEVLEHASILHDIGKIGIDTGILNKDGALTSSEYSLVKAHPLIGEEILGPVDELDDVRTTIMQHHERFDGKGYPYGLAGEEISLKARILAVVDTFDAMLTDRPYRKAFPYAKVIEELRTGAGTQFDPFVVESFVEMLGEKGEEFLYSAGYALNMGEGQLKNPA